MSEENLIQLGPHERMTVDECLAFCERTKSQFEAVIVIGCDEGQNLIVRSSHMSRGDAVLLILAALDNARGK